jgi:hypothetical protein
MLNANFSPFEDNNGATKMGLGAGVQWTKAGIYARPDHLKGTPNPFFLMYVGELSAQFVIGKYEGVSFGLFARAGGGKEGSLFLGGGMKFGWRNHF